MAPTAVIITYPKPEETPAALKQEQQEEQQRDNQHQDVVPAVLPPPVASVPDAAVDGELSSPDLGPQQATAALEEAEDKVLGQEAERQAVEQQQESEEKEAEEQEAVKLEAEEREAKRRREEERLWEEAERRAAEVKKRLQEISVLIQEHPERTLRLASNADVDFGSYKASKVSDLPGDYLQWMLALGWFCNWKYGRMPLYKRTVLQHLVALSMLRVTEDW